MSEASPKIESLPKKERVKANFDKSIQREPTGTSFKLKVTSKISSDLLLSHL